MLCVDGVNYASITDFCSKNDLGIGYATVLKKLKGKSTSEKEELLSRLVKDSYPFCINGRKYKSIKDFCSKNDLGIEYTTVLKRLKGKSTSEKEELLSRLVKDSYSFCIKGRKYKSIKEFCSKNSLSVCYETLQKRTSGKSLEEKLRILESSLEEGVYIIGIRFKSMKDACKFFNTNFGVCRVRRCRGWSVRDSVLGKEPVTVLSRKCAERIVKQRLEDGFPYGMCLMFTDEDQLILNLSEDAEKFVNSFFDQCENGVEPMKAYKVAINV